MWTSQRFWRPVVAFLPVILRLSIHCPLHQLDLFCTYNTLATYCCLSVNSSSPSNHCPLSLDLFCILTILWRPVVAFLPIILRQSTHCPLDQPDLFCTYNTLATCCCLSANNSSPINPLSSRSTRLILYLQYFSDLLPLSQ